MYVNVVFLFVLSICTLTLVNGVVLVLVIIFTFKFVSLIIAGVNLLHGYHLS